MSGELIDIITGGRNALAAVVDADYPSGVHGRERKIRRYDWTARRWRVSVANDCSSKREELVQPAPEIETDLLRQKAAYKRRRSNNDQESAIIAYVRENGPALLDEIASATGTQKKHVSAVMRRSGGIAEWRKVKAGWGGSQRTWRLP